MKKKIVTSLLIVVLSATVFAAGRFTAQEKVESQIDLMNTAIDNVQYWEVTDTGLDLYDYDGNVYEWR